MYKMKQFCFIDNLGGANTKDIPILDSKILTHSSHIILDKGCLNENC